MKLLRLKQMRDRILIDLDGLDGNVFVLIEWAMKVAVFIDKSKTEVVREMTKADYNNAVKYFNDNFSKYFELRTTNEELIKILKDK